jgi:hypothetical protein
MRAKYLLLGGLVPLFIFLLLAQPPAEPEPSNISYTSTTRTPPSRNATPTPIFNCSNPDDAVKLAQDIAINQTYIRNKYDCTQFSKALVANLTIRGCTARMTRGWYGLKGTERGWHVWVSTPDFEIEATPKGIGIIEEGSPFYDESYSNPVNMSWDCPCD